MRIMFDTGRRGGRTRRDGWGAWSSPCSARLAREHIGLDIFTPPPFVGLEKHIRSDQLGDFLAGYRYADDLVVDQNRRRIG